MPVTDQSVERAYALAVQRYADFGIDTEQTFLNNAGRPIAVLPSGQPIAELL